MSVKNHCSYTRTFGYISEDAIEENRGVFGGVFLPAEYGIDVGKLRHRRPVSLSSPAECSSWLVY